MIKLRKGKAVSSTKQSICKTAEQLLVFWCVCLVLMELKKCGHSFVVFETCLWIKHKKQQPLEAFDHRQQGKGGVNYQIL